MSVFAGVGERSREGNDLIHEMTESGVIAKTAFVFGQMNEPPGARQRVGLTGLTMAEYFRDEEGRDVLLFIDNIFRFTQAGSEVSALLGRMPSRGRLPAEPGHRDGRASRSGSRRPRRARSPRLQAVFVPGRRLHRPGAGDDVRPPRLDDPPRALHRRARDLPGGRPADLDVARARPARRRPGALRRRPGDEARPPALPRPPGHHRDPRHRRAVRGGQGDGRPGPPPPAVHEPAVLRRPRSSPAGPASTSPIKDTVASFKEILEGKADTLPEQAFFLAGTLDDVRANAEKLAGLDDADPARDRHARAARVQRRGRQRRRCPGSEGELGVLPHHAPLVATLGVGRAADPQGRGRGGRSRSSAASSRCGRTRSS